MKRPVKILLISLSAIILLSLAIVLTAIGIISSSSKLTSLVNKYSQEFLPCRTDIGSVDLVFLKTFPHVSVMLRDVVVINPYEGARSDTLLRAESACLGIDIKEFLKSDNIISDRIEIKNASANIYVDSLGGSNLDIFMTDDQQDEPFELPFDSLSLQKVVFDNIDISYIDEQSKIASQIDGIKMLLKAHADNDELTVEQVKLDCRRLAFSSSEEQAEVVAGDIGMNIKGQADKSAARVTAKISLPHVSAAMGKETYAKDLGIEAKIPLNISFDENRYETADGSLNVGGLKIGINGYAAIEGEDIATDIRLEGKSWSIEDIVALVPESFLSYLNGIKATGKADIDATVKGIYNASRMPDITVAAYIFDTDIEYDMLPFPLKDIDTKLTLSTDLKDDSQSTLRIESFSARTPRSRIKASGSVGNLLSDMTYRLTLNADLNLNEFESFIPDSLNMTIAGNTEIEVDTRFRMSDIENGRYWNIKLKGTLSAPNLQAGYDTINASIATCRLDIELPGETNNTKQGKKPFATAVFCADSFNVNAGSAKAQGNKAELSADMSEFPALTQFNSVKGDFSFGTLSFECDTINSNATSLKGNFSARGVFADTTSIPEAELKLDLASLDAQICDTIKLNMNNASLKAKDIIAGNKFKPQIELEFNQGSMNASIGSQNVQVGQTDIKANLKGDLTQKDILLQWTPQGYVSVKNAVAKTDAIPDPITIPEIDFQFSPEEYRINRSRVSLGVSDFELSGTFSNVNSYLHNDSLLRGELKFISEVTDVNYFMNLFSGLGEEQQVGQKAGEEVEYAPDEIVVPQLTKVMDTKPKEPTEQTSGPFIVPKGISMVLDTRIDNALIGTNVARNVNGKVTVDDGVLVLDDLNFTSSAAKVQLTAMYKSPRPNNLYVGIDYHMLDVEIGNLLATFPDLGEMMPMLNSFGGSGEFHMAIETNLDSLYNLKKSTLRGAASIYGKDLVVMDGETFSTIARKLHFSKAAENKIDSLSAEFTVFRNEIDIYPFLVVMDRYKAIIGGRHNLDMSLNYNISMIHNPFLPIRIGVDIFGSPEDLKFRLRRCRYDADYRPVSRKSLDAAQINLRNMIYNSLSSGVIRTNAGFQTQEPIE